MTDPPTNTPDVLFKSPLIVSGVPGAIPFVADVLVSKGHIKLIAENITDAEHAIQVDGRGKILCPGFIDLHAHSDLYLLSHPDHEAKISQGCTTEVVGQDGISYAPILTTAQMVKVREQIAGWNGNPTDEECHTALEGVGMFEWNTIGEYLDCLDRNRITTNVAMLVPQGNLRLLAVGSDNKEPTEEQMVQQVELLRQGMQQGAVGMSSGLTYTPGMYASDSELAILCAVLHKEFPGAYYGPHHRSYGHKALDSYREMLELGKKTKCPVHLTHATLNFAENKEKAEELLKMIDDYRSSGDDITLDTYPYLPGCTTLAALLPSWANEGGPQRTLQRLADKEICEAIRYDMEVKGCDGGHGIPIDWSEIQVGTCTVPSLSSWSGERVSTIAEREGDIPSNIYFEILREEKLATSCIMHVGNEENVQKIMCHETHCSGSDAILHGDTLHPRAYGTFPRFLGHYARDVGLMSIPSMIEHLTSRPAKRLGIYPHRGCVAEDSAADLVLFDPKTISAKATFEDSKRVASGIHYVLVNGRVAVSEGKLTRVRAGTTLRRRKDGSVGNGKLVENWVKQNGHGHA